MKLDFLKSDKPDASQNGQSKLEDTDEIIKSFRKKVEELPKKPKRDRNKVKSEAGDGSASPSETPAKELKDD